MTLGPDLTPLGHVQHGTTNGTLRPADGVRSHGQLPGGGRVGRV